MKVVHLSSVDVQGGAAIAAFRIHKGLIKKGIGSSMVVQKKLSNDPTVLGPQSLLVQSLGYAAPVLDQLWAKKIFKTQNKVLHSFSWLPSIAVQRYSWLKPDIVHLHWICGGFLTPESLLKITSPIVWTLHDMWPFCGAEHYTSDLRYLEGYKKNNRPSYESGPDLNKWVWLRKEKVYKKINLTIVSPSTWLAKKAKESILFRDKEISVIPYGIDLSLFGYIDKRVARNILNIPTNKKIILFGADWITSDLRKGWDLLLKILKKIDKKNLFLITFGRANESDLQKSLSTLNIPYKHLGFLHDETSLRLAYSCADIYLMPSRQDNLPNTLLESLACGTPAIAFDIGGIADIIDDYQDGFLIPSQNTDLFAKKIDIFFKDIDLEKKMSVNARQKIATKFNLEKTTKQYLKIYQKLLLAK